MKKYIGLTLALALALCGTQVHADNHSNTQNEGRHGFLGQLFRKIGAGTNIHPMAHWDAHGTITAINGTTLTVAAKSKNGGTETYTVEAANATVLYRGTKGTLGSLKVGDSVVITGSTDATTNGTHIIATRISGGATTAGAAIHDAIPGTLGKVTAINGTTLTLVAQSHPDKDTNAKTTATYTVKASNTTVIKNGASVPFDTITVGDSIFVRGTASGNTITATRLYLWDKNYPGSVFPGVQNNGQPIIYGSISAISGNTITVTNKENVTYTVNGTDSMVTVPGTSPASISMLSVGDYVLIQGSVNGTSVTAATIIDQPMKTATATHASIFAKLGDFLKRFLK
jgi:hypothetical protein